MILVKNVQVTEDVYYEIVNCGNCVVEQAVP